MTVKISYIGHQPRKAASQVIETCRIVWEGHGDVQEVPDDVANILLQSQYNKIWQKVVDVPAEPLAPAPVLQHADPAAEAEAARVAAEAEKDAEAARAAAADAELTAEQVRERLEKIVLVIPKLAKKDFTNEGVPKLSALSALVGYSVTAAERDAAWDAVVAASGTPAADQRPADASGDAPE